MNKPFSLMARASSFVYAFNGLKILLREQHNFRIHLVATIIVATMAFALGATATQWVLLLIIMALVSITEALNSAVEYLCDRVCETNDPLIGKAKDVAAAAVLISSILAFVSGLIIFIPLIF